MAVERVVRYQCDGCGEYAAAEKITVVRIGTIEDRPEDCERLDVGPECLDRPLRHFLQRTAVSSGEQG